MSQQKLSPLEETKTAGEMTAKHAERLAAEESIRGKTRRMEP
jgi:hypothetical protein